MEKQTVEPIPGKNKPFIVANVREIFNEMECNNVSFSRGVEMLNEVAAKYYANQSTQPAGDGWVSVETLPNGHEWVLCLNEKSDEMKVCQKYHNITDISHKFVYMEGGIWHGFTTTKWQPLPAPPNQTDNQ